MNVLVDTNVLGRMAEPAHAQHRLAITSTDALDQRGDQLCVVPQVLYEFWVVATRPAADNGLGLSAAEATAELSRLKTLFVFLSDSAATYSEWKRLVTAHQVTVAVHGLTHLLTFNTAHFGN